MNRSVIVLDLDGVILKTNLVKYRAMLSLFAQYKEYQATISAYILARGGVPRRDKFIGILREIVGTTPTEALLARYLQRYANALEYELAIAPMVEGMTDFLAAGGRTFNVSSSAPEGEVQQQLARRNLTGYFAVVYGSQTPKEEALRQIIAAHPQSTVVFFGDSLGDWEAAQAAGVAFVAVVNERDNFAERPVVKLNDFVDTLQVERCMQSALQNSSNGATRGESILNSIRLSEIMMNASDELFLRRAIALAWQARQTGADPYGAVLVKDGQIVQEAYDNSVESSDPTAHAELKVLRDYCRLQHQFVLSGYTLYASAEPYLMCSGAIRWSGISRVVYSVSQQRVQELSGARPTASYLPLVNAVHQRVEIIGPLLEDEGLRVFANHRFDSKPMRHRELWSLYQEST